MSIAQTATGSPSLLVTIASVLATVLGSAATGVASVWAWFRKELEDCKSDRRELFARVEQLHDKVSDLNRRVGHVEQSSGSGPTTIH